RPEVGGFLLELLRVAASPLRLGRGQVPVPFGGQSLNRAHPLGEAGQGEERFLRRRQPGRVLLLGLLQLGFAVAGRGERGFQAGAGLDRRRLVGLVLDQLGGQRRVII